MPRIPATLARAAAMLALGCPLAAPAAPAADEAASLARLADQATTELHGNILPFWIEHVRNETGGGFHGEVRADLSPNEKAPRGALMTCRILWTYSAAMRRDARPEYRAMADHAFADLNARFWDEFNGGLIWSVNADGSPLARHKQVYLQTFGIYALAEYHRATDDPLALARARTLFRLLEDNARDPQHGGYFEAFTPDWSKEMPEMRRTIGGNAPKSQNTHLHIMEAYTNLLRVWPDPELRSAQTRLVGLMLERILDPQTHHLGLFFKADWSPDSNSISYGHDIEAAWLLCEAAGVLEDAALLERTRTAAVEIARVTLAEGVSLLGGIYNEGGPRGVTNDDHEWWPQAEAVVGFLNAYQISGDKRFLDAATTTWNFIDTHVIDRERGEWFLMVDAKGRPQSRRPKASIWKCPYHNGRACMEIADRVNAILSR